MTQFFALREAMFRYYLMQIAKLVPSKWKEQPYGLWLFLLPILMITAVLHTVSTYYCSNLVNFFLEALLLLCCLGPFSIYRQQSDVAEDLFEQAYTGLFSVLFWFTILGPTGVVLFRVLERIANASDRVLDSLSGNVVMISQPLISYLNWLPLRFFMGIQAAFGKFPYALRYWLDHLLTSASYNKQLVADSGRVALGLPVEAKLNTDDYLAALALFDKILVVFLALTLSYVVVAWSI